MKVNPLDRIPSESIAPGSERVLYICACRPWNQSGILMEKGQEYRFQIPDDGEIEAWIDGSTDATPLMGWTGKLENTIGYLFSFLKRSHKANWYALVGAIGQCDEDEDTFAISPKPVVIPKRGELYFYANDMKGRYFNNRGIIKLKVIRVR